MTGLPDTALSVRQPWAWAIVQGLKDIENRDRVALTHGRQPKRLAIHAAQGMTMEEYEAARAFMADLGVACPRPDHLVRGAIVGAVTVGSVVETSDSPWFFGPRGLCITDAVAIDPIPATGALGFFRWQQMRHAGDVARPRPWMVKWQPTEDLS